VVKEKKGLRAGFGGDRWLFWGKKGVVWREQGAKEVTVEKKKTKSHINEGEGERESPKEGGGENTNTEGGLSCQPHQTNHQKRTTHTNRKGP